MPLNESLLRVLNKINLQIENDCKEKALALGLDKDQLEGHAWNNKDANLELITRKNYQAEATLNYLRKRPDDVSVSQAMDQIRGLTAYQIEAMELDRSIGRSLTREQLLQGHDWDNEHRTGLQDEAALKVHHVCQASVTLEYLSKSPKDVTVSEAMNQIRGLNIYQILAMSLGLTRKQIQGHGWYNEHQDGYQAEATLKYLHNRPVDVSVQQAMNNIRGLFGRDIYSIVKAMQRGVRVLNLSNRQVYSCRFDETKFNRIQNGETYEAVCKEGHEAILAMEKTRQKYTIGAASKAFPLMMEFANKAIGIKEAKREGEEVKEELKNPVIKIASYLTVSDAIKLAQVTKETLNTARFFVGYKKCKRRDNKGYVSREIGS